ncbi:MAG TPA: PPOX class F420-dependent oxidoreductase [Polyangiaceae bacterium]|nr:PPOX class F420-dependent oxidoreductase [Polyangiaceae bacterium]
MPRAEIALFDKHDYLSLATFRKTGALVKTPVWFAAWGDKLYVFSAGDAGKVKRLRNSSRARIAPCDVRGKVRGEWLDTSARIVTDPAVVEGGYAALRRKYGWQMALGNFFARISGKIGRRALIEIDY